ncbi:hypothetical protein P3T76_008930 [Phytophthora citrophthora]|uniref:FYVE-type domain-containing protein n=1 Tax=Phytophthora citrophthora TaxID=4793 RepID=A0AAD9LJK5_9STRA|nr:hypothetical protein P3T76_008930 [Phytophthora citrophthora]
MADAEALHDRLEFATFVGIAESPRLPNYRDGQAQWKRVERSSTFTLLKREDEVLALVRLDASVEEVASILTATTDQLHNSAMKGLYGDSFISGSVAYVERANVVGHERICPQLTVKTTSFVHSDMLGKNEQWCFAETLRFKSKDNSFTLTQGSLSAQQAHSLPACSAQNDGSKRVAQLRDVTAAYLVEQMPGSHGLRVVFHAIYQPDSENEKLNRSEGGGEAPAATRKAVHARLLRLARGISQLSQLVRRRRFRSQVYADRSAFDVRNPRCTCCTKKLSSFKLFTAGVRCYLCGYYVCVTCSSSEKMEAINGRLASIIVCSRCRKSVAACNYDHMMTVIPGPEQVLPDRISTHDFPISPTSSQASSSSSVLTDFLGQVINEGVGSSRSKAALLVLEQLISADKDEAQVQTDLNDLLLNKASFSKLATQALDVSKYPKDLSACKFASADSRPYPMLPTVISDEKVNQEPMYPIPENEEVRMAAIEHFRLHDVANIPELNVICSLAAAEMNCPHSVLTLVERKVVTLMATNDPSNWDVGSGNPREQTFCQHFVMDDQPLLVRHAEADMRFYHILPVTMRSLRFYAGFPVTVSSATNNQERVVVGALCCLDAKPHQMTRSEYWRLMKLAEAASSILERNAIEFIADPENHPLTQNHTNDPAMNAKETVAVAC